MKLNAIKAAIAPYIVWIQVGVLAAVIGGGVWLGFKLDPDTDCGQMDAETAAELATLRKANAGYEELERARALEASNKQQQSEEEKKRLANAVRIAQAKANALEKRLRANELARAEADKDPKCAELMQLQVCEAIPLP